MIINCNNEIWVHKMRWDFRIAPCVDFEALSQAICITKTRISPDMKIGDILVGIGGMQLVLPGQAGGGQGRIIYVAKVKEIIPGDVYYTKPIYLDRLDCVYEDIGNGVAKHRGSLYPNAEYLDPTHIDRDIGPTRLLKDARILWSEDFLYLGNEGREDYSHHKAMAWLTGFGQLHRRLKKYPRTYLAFRDHLLQLTARYPKNYTGLPTIVDSNRRNWHWYKVAKRVLKQVYGK